MIDLKELKRLITIANEQLIQNGSGNPWVPIHTPVLINLIQKIERQSDLLLYALTILPSINRRDNTVSASEFKGLIRQIEEALK